MERFSKKELAGSLFCPIMSFLWGLIRFLNAVGSGLKLTGTGSFRLSFIGAMVIGGVLCTVLTLMLDIHTESYLNKRLILIAAVFISHVIIGRFTLSSYMFYFVAYLFVGIIAYIVLFTKIRDVNTDLGEMTILLLSDSILYWTLSQALEYIYFIK